MAKKKSVPTQTADDAPAYELEWTEYSKADYDALDGSQKIVIDKGLNRIRQRGMQAGAPLSGALAGCNKLKHQKLGLRIVFRQTERGVQIIQIIAIGKRSNSAIYTSASQRL